jgi:soluble lytic murein transglycosylase
MSMGRRNTSWRRPAFPTSWRVILTAAVLATVCLLVPAGRTLAQTPNPEVRILAAADLDSEIARLAMLRFGPIGRPDYLTLPRPLAAGDAYLYRTAFEAAARGEREAMERALGGTADRRLQAHVRAEYLLSPASRPGFAELAGWLRDNPRHPSAPAVYALASSQAPKGKLRSLTVPAVASAAPRIAVATDLGPGKDIPAPPGRADLGRKDLAAREKLRARLNNHIRAAELDSAERLLGPEAGRLLSPAELDYYKLRIAAGLFARDGEERAYDLAAAAAARSGDTQPRAHWVAGLAAFATSRFDLAASHFETLARLPRAHSWEISAAAFWAGRSNLHARKFDAVDPWFEVAAEHPRSFYGLLASRALSRTLPFDWEAPEVEPEQIAELARHPVAQLALMLVQVGQPERAEAEFARLVDTVPDTMRPTIFVVVLRANLPRLASQLGRRLAAGDGRRFEAAAYPVPPWQPSQGFSIDPALIYAFMRQESRFDPHAVSPAGARGLMQIMPKTAAQLHGAPVPVARLHDPVFNITLGQRYIAQLLESETVEGDLIRLAASYNAGPQTVLRWKQRRDLRERDIRDDALLAIETLPSPETRHFITRVLYSYWMYSERLGQPAPSLDAVAEGRWPSYVPPVFLTARASPGNAKDR